MRITDDRYHRDRQKLDLAMRMIRHEARTATIQAWTGLSAARIRKLHQSYVVDGASLARRHRGKPPRQTGYFLRNRSLRRQAVALGGIYAMLGLLRAAADGLTATPANSEWTEAFCLAFETFAELELGGDITFEHAVYLLEALRRGSELQPGCCPCCGGFMLIDAQRLTRARCPSCEDDPHPTATARAPSPEASGHARIGAPSTEPRRVAQRLRRTVPRS